MAGGKKRKRRTRTDHRGVKIVCPKRTGRWKAVWKDPDSGRVAQQSFDDLGITTAEGRRGWAIEKSRALFSRRQALALGSPRNTGLSLGATFEVYFDERGQRLKGGTRDGYETAVEIFLGWAQGRGLTKADELRKDHLTAFVDWLAVQKAKAPVKGGTPRERRATQRVLATSCVNGRVRGLKAVLNHLRRRGKLAHLNGDDIKDSLRLLKEPKRKPKFLRPEAVKALLRAAIRHDQETFAMTREERAQGAKGKTPRHRPIAPFVLFMLLTGCRLEETLALTWNAIALDAKNEHGALTGEISLLPELVKTSHERTIDLGVSSCLRRLLMTLKLAAGGEAHVFGAGEPYSRTIVERARRRLVGQLGAPQFTWSQIKGTTPSLRATCSSYLTNAPGIFRAAAAFRSAAQLGHSVQIAQKHYVGLIRGIPLEARTLEAAMGVEAESESVLALIGGTPPAADSTAASTA